jgi:hypothetical protein
MIYSAYKKSGSGMEGISRLVLKSFERLKVVNSKYLNGEEG